MSDGLKEAAAAIVILARQKGLEMNSPTPEGRELGKHLARFADAELAERKKRFPNHVERCATCAFRRGTIPNGCVRTLMDALKCIVEGKEIFECHERENHDCVGYAVLRRYDEGLEMSWKFSPEYK